MRCCGHEKGVTREELYAGKLYAGPEICAAKCAQKFNQPRPQSLILIAKRYAGDEVEVSQGSPREVVAYELTPLDKTHLDAVRCLI